MLQKFSCKTCLQILALKETTDIVIDDEEYNNLNEQRD